MNIDKFQVSISVSNLEEAKRLAEILRQNALPLDSDKVKIIETVFSIE